MEVSIIELALAVSAKPVSVDTLVEWGLARPSALIAWLDAARARKVVSEDASSGPGHFRLTDEARSAALARATTQDFRILVRQPSFIPELLEAAKREAARRGAGMAAELYRAVFDSVAPEEFPGGPVGYVDSLVEGLRLYRGVAFYLRDALDRAIALAVERGDLASQAPLLAARALNAAHGESPRESDALLAHAREAAEAVSGAVRVEVLTYSAVSLVYMGRLREGIAAFESLLGDVPDDLVTLDHRLLITPEALCVLAVAYSNAGQHARAIDLMHRMFAFGDREGAAPVRDLAGLFLGLLHATMGEFEAAGEFAETAYDKFISGATDPSLGWFAGTAQSLVRASQGLMADARAALEAGAAAWKRAGSRPMPGLAVYDVVDQIEAAGEAPLTGIDMAAEAERATKMPLAQAAGLGHRYLAMRAARVAGTDEELAAAAARLETAIGLLSEAGALYDLARVCNEAAALAERRCRPDEARRFRSDAAKASPIGERSAERDALGLRSAVLGLGRLPLRKHGEGLWGEIAARLCEGLGAERCAIVEAGNPPRLLAVRGGSRVWSDALVADITGCCDCSIGFVKPPWNEEDRDEEGQLLVIPFSSTALRRTGWVALENRRVRPGVGSKDRAVIEVLGEQLSILFENTALWQELQAVRVRLEQENRYYRQQEGTTAGSGSIIGHSPALKSTLDLVARVAPTDSAVLITGETGVGKELVAREIHRSSRRADGPFIAVHIASLAPGLVASGLFGHEKGAFTGATSQVRGRFELADGGTLFLDEIGELGLEEQVRLLRVLQEGTFERVGGTRPIRSDFRLVAATNRDLSSLARSGRFREDLYYRLNVFPILMPPLRDRSEDIPTLALYFMEQSGRRLGRKFEGIGEADMARLTAYPWPGNVRELMHCIERAAVLSDGPRLRIPPLDPAEAPSSASAGEDAAPGGIPIPLAEAERRHIKKVLQHAKGRITGTGGAAEILGLNPSTLHFRIGKLGLKGELARARKTEA